MKKTLFLAAIAALFTFASCQKEIAPIVDEKGDLLFTATIAGPGTKTSVTPSNGKVEWVIGDEISITENGIDSVKYVVSSIDANGKATFTKKDGETGTLGAGPYTATYLKDFDFENQTCSATVPALPMSGESKIGNPTELEFTVSCGLVVYSLKSSEDITQMLYSCRFQSDDYDLVYHYVDEEVELPPSSATTPLILYCAVPPGRLNCFFDGDDGYSSINEFLDVSANNIYPVSAQFYFTSN